MRYNPLVSSLQIIYASTSGHTEYVTQRIVGLLKGIDVHVMRAEQSGPDDLLKGDVLMLASSTWNTGGQEGQLNPHMWSLLMDRAKDVDLKGKQVVLVGLGDHRYFYTVGALSHMNQYVEKRGGKKLCEDLRIVDEPFEQNVMIDQWTKDVLLPSLSQ